MSIRIIEEPEIVLTRAEYESLQSEWQQTQSLTVRPSSFETWLRQRQLNVVQAAHMERMALQSYANYPF